MKYKKLLPAHHTGKIQHHRHTSYAALGLMLVLTGAVLAMASRSVALADAGPVTLQNSVTAVVAAAVPTTAPTIGNVTSGTVYTNDDPLTLSGTCPKDTLLKIFKNNVFAGAVLCKNGKFSIDIDLFLGTNTIIIRAYNATNNPGPDSAPIVLKKQLPDVGIPALIKQFSVTSDVYYKGVSVGDTLTWPITIGGGQAPYAVSISWGDGETDLISRATEGSFDVSHVYKKPGKGYKGSYDVTILTTDAAGEKSFIHLVSIVSGGDQNVVGAIKNGYDLSGTMKIAWKVVGVSALVIGGFWLGEQRELWMLKRSTRRI